MSCEVCGAPPLRTDGACVFCRSPLPEAPDPARLLDYLASRYRGARVRRGPFRTGTVRALTILAAGEVFRGRRVRARLVLQPESDPAAWADGLVAALSRDAVRDGEVRAAVTGAGWALR